MSSNQDLPAARVGNNAGRTPAVAENVPNWYDGPVTMWAIVDRDGRPYAFDSERVAHEVLEGWESRLRKFGPYKIIKLVEDR